MLNRLLSGDMPRSRVLAVLLLLIFLGLAAAPFVFPGVKALNVAAKVLIFVVLVASCLLYTSPSPRDLSTSRMPSSA